MAGAVQKNLKTNRKIGIGVSLLNELARIKSVGTAVPQYAMQQSDIKQFAAGLFRSHFKDIDRLIPIFENSCIKTRYLSRPLEWYITPHTFSEANQIFETVALELMVKAAQEALDRAGAKPEDVGTVVYVTSTGITTPTLDTKLIQALSLPVNTVRIPIWGLGCAGGAAGLARSAQLAACQAKNKVVLFVAVELCSLTYQREDFSKSNLVGTSLFADGAAAVVLGTDGGGPAICGFNSTLIPNTEDIMGWELTDSGLKVIFSRDIPWVIGQYLPKVITDACDTWGIRQEAVQHYVTHPGGAKVLKAYTESLGIPEDKLSQSYSVLENYGNMSSASILFVLEKFMANTAPTGGLGLMVSLGPGFSAEQVLFKW
jgi:alkylresorcinol/alkylpyrone synthase